MMNKTKANSENLVRVAVVGPCASGKSTLCTALRAAGYEARHPAQEHSYVQNMWQRLTKPDLLIYLDVNYENVLQRRSHNLGGERLLHEQNKRLAHARQYCDFYVDTNKLTVAEVETAVFTFLHAL